MATKLTRRLFSAMILAAAVLFLPTARPQQPVDPPSAPVPVAIRSAQKAFISNSSGETLIGKGVSELAYNEFYAAIKSWGRYALVATPAEADLVLEIRYTPDDQLHLILRDPKTNVLLWAFSEGIDVSQRKITARKNFDLAMTNLVGDLKNLAG